MASTTQHQPEALRLRQQEAERLQLEATALYTRLDDRLISTPTAEPAAVSLTAQVLSASLRGVHM